MSALTLVSFAICQRNCNLRIAICPMITHTHTHTPHTHMSMAPSTCIQITSATPPLSGHYEQSKDYIVSAELSSSWIEKYSNRYGFVGLAFNMEDARNYDIAYVRYLFLLLPASYAIELP